MEAGAGIYATESRKLSGDFFESNRTGSGQSTDPTEDRGCDHVGTTGRRNRFFQADLLNDLILHRIEVQLSVRNDVVGELAGLNAPTLNIIPVLIVSKFAGDIREGPVRIAGVDIDVFRVQGIVGIGIPRHAQCQSCAGSGGDGRCADKGIEPELCAYRVRIFAIDLAVRLGGELGIKFGSFAARIKPEGRHLEI